MIEKIAYNAALFFFRFLRYFIDECDNIVSPQLKRAQETSKTSQDKFEEALSRVSDLKKIWQEVYIYIYIISKSIVKQQQIDILFQGPYYLLLPNG